jgi:threonine dehydrogenase-like Zn-dependent dehydrogenase
MTQQALQIMLGISVFVADRAPERLALAQHLGSPRTIQSGSEDLVAIVQSLTGGEGADVVVDAVGATETKKLALAATRAGGATVWIGLHENTITLDSYDITLPERAVLGSYGAILPDLQIAVDLMVRGDVVDVESWTTVLSLEQGVTGWQKALAAEEVKVILTP